MNGRTGMQVLCDSSRHPDKVVEIATFSRTNGIWRPFLYHHRSDGKLAMIPAFPGDEVLPPESRTWVRSTSGREAFMQGFDADGNRVAATDSRATTFSFSFRCPFCGTEERVKGERLGPILERLADLDMGTVNLDQMAFANRV